MTLLDRLLGREHKSERLRPLGVRDAKAVYGGSVLGTYQRDIPLSSLLNDPQTRVAAFLRAYKCGWFYKAGHKISADIASLKWTISDGDAESGDREAILKRPDLDIPFERLSPIDQLQRLLERPNPNQTGRQLFTKTQIRRDFAGTNMWYLENGAGGGLPTAIYGISPARMTPSRDRSGTLIGWVMDYDSPNPVPFSADEILNMPMASAEDGDGDLFGVGVVEAVYSELPLTDIMARHTTDLLTTGGRLAGMLWPKERTLTEDEFNDAVRAWRNVASDPNAARRMLIFPEPMEWAAGASTPAEIGLPELSTVNRDNILSAFPISPHLLRVPMPSGLNASGETRREEEAAYWSDIETLRVEPLKDYIQTGLVSRYEAVMGQTFDFDLPIPNLDDAPSLQDKVEAFKGLVSVGFDPKEAVAAVGLDQIKWLGLPDLLDPAKQLQMQQEAQQAQADASGIAVSAGDTSRRDSANTQVAVSKSKEDVTARSVKRGTAILSDFLTEQRDRVVNTIETTFPKSKAARKDAPWWDAKEEDRLLSEALKKLYLEVGREGLQTVADQLGRIVANKNVARILGDLIEYGGSRITAINETTRQAISLQIAEGTRRGYSIPQLVNGVPADNYPGVKAALLDNGIPAFDGYRAEMIARTETALSYNRAALTGYGEFGVTKMQAIDGDGDDECASRDGHIFDLEEALAIEDHPNGTLDWAPVLDKTVHQPIHVEPHVNVTWPSLKIEMPEQAAPVVTVTNEVPAPNVEVLVPQGPTPVVNVTNDVQTPEVVVKAPVVNVTNDVKTPEVNVTTPAVRVTNEVRDLKVTVDAAPVNVTNEVHVPEAKPPVVRVVNEVQTPDVVVKPAKPLKRRVIRDRDGKITGIEDA